uniref:SLATT domain-containing protein n=1 Tax=Marinobacterium profundum TaxID=1714300 RepID=UPI00082E8A6D|nr:SLATT domain-containing protein [Marinobacterium profundum]
MDDNFKKLRKELDDKIWRTKGARFNAHRRLNKKQNLVVFVTSVSSIHLISLSILQISNVLLITERQDSLISFSSIIVSIVILVYGLVEGGKNYGLLSEVHHRCGIEIDRVYKRIFTSGNIADLLNISDTYDDLLQKFSTNHDLIDDQFFIASHSKEYKETHSYSFLKRKTVSIIYLYKDMFIGLLAVLIPTITSLSILFKDVLF